MDRLPIQFRQNESQWGDLDLFIASRSRSNAITHFKAYQEYLRIIIRFGTEEQKRVSEDLLATKTVS